MDFFGKSRELEGEVEDYLETIQKSGLVFYEAIREYMTDESELFEKRVVEIKKIEQEADRLRRNIKHKLYSHMLIPDSRGDVLALLETLDDVVDASYKILQNFSIETPLIPAFLKPDFLKMAEYSEKTIDALVKASHAYFTNINAVNDYINRVFFFEHEIDDVEERIKRAAFSTDEIKAFSRRVHLRYFAGQIASLSDVAESVVDRLSVFVIKREI